MMRNRIDLSKAETREMHHKAIMYLLRCCANLKILHDAGQPFRADPSTLEEWATHRNDLAQCSDEITRYGQYSHERLGPGSKHSELILAANAIVVELKLHNIGEKVKPISIQQVEELERMVMRLDCRKRVVFY